MTTSARIVLRTHDDGKTWTKITNGLPAGHFVTAVRADPVTPGLLYAGNEAGVFVSFDDGDDWQPLQRNLPTAWARDLLVHGDDLIAATQGRAIWVLDDLALLRQLQPASASEPFHLFAPAPAVRVRVDNNHDTPLAARNSRRPEPARRRDHRLLARKRAARAGHARDPRFVRRGGPAFLERRRAGGPARRPLFPGRIG